MAMLFLLRLNIGKKPAPAPSSRRVLSPWIGSTLITSAPRSASIIPHVGPITMCVNSTTRNPASGCGAVSARTPFAAARGSSVGIVTIVSSSVSRAWGGILERPSPGPASAGRIGNSAARNRRFDRRQRRDVADDDDRRARDALGTNDVDEIVECRDRFALIRPRGIGDDRDRRRRATSPRPSRRARICAACATPM